MLRGNFADCSLFIYSLLNVHLPLFIMFKFKDSTRQLNKSCFLVMYLSPPCSSYPCSLAGAPKSEISPVVEQLSRFLSAPFFLAWSPFLGLSLSPSVSLIKLRLRASQARLPTSPLLLQPSLTSLMRACVTQAFRNPPQLIT